MEIKKIKLSEIKENPRNPKKHAVDKIEESIKKVGEMDPIIVDENDMILAGHGRLKAMKKIGKPDTEVIVKRGLTQEQKDYFLLVANKAEELGGWDFEALANWDEKELIEAGWDSDEIDSIFKGDEYEDEFDGEKEHEEIKKSIVKTGELYQLGNHRLCCGDAIKPESFKKLMNGKEADMVFTDPPYNMNYKSKKKGGIMNDNMGADAFIDFSIEYMARMKENLKTGGVFYICSGYSSYVPFLYAIKSNGLDFANPIIWVKNQLGMGMNDYRHSHEMIVKGKNNKKKAQPIMYGWNGGKHYFINAHDEADVWEIKKRATNTMVHPTQKPIEMICRAIRNSSKRGDIILDQFGGSGSTLIAAEKEGRKDCVHLRT